MAVYCVDTEANEGSEMTTLIDVLNDTEGRKAIDLLEDVLSSLRAYPDGDPTLEEIRDSLVDDIESRFDFRYEI